MQFSNCGFLILLIFILYQFIHLFLSYERSVPSSNLDSPSGCHPRLIAFVSHSLCLTACLFQDSCSNLSLSRTTKASLCLLSKFHSMFNASVALSSYCHPFQVLCITRGRICRLVFVFRIK